MSRSADARASEAFAALTPDTVITLVEEELGEPCVGLCHPLNSYINRVYDLETKAGEGVIAKFYRPNRWSLDALQDEMDFLLDLREADVPVIPPITRHADGPGDAEDSLRVAELDEGTLTFALFPKCGGRTLVEPTDDQWEQLGRLLGRVHRVGAAYDPEDRITLHPEHSGRTWLSFILESGTVTPEARDEYTRAVEDTLDMIVPLFEDIDTIRIHGDLHVQNLIDRPGEATYIIDFDDMAIGPAVQDVWMLLPARIVDCGHELEQFLRGYETFFDFSFSSLRLVEPLRAMRFLHFTAWCARQVADGGFTRLAPDFGTHDYWIREARELRQQQQEIQTALDRVTPWG